MNPQETKVSSSEWPNWDLSPRLKAQLERTPIDHAIYVENGEVLSLEVVSLPFTFAQEVSDFECFLHGLVQGEN